MSNSSRGDFFSPRFSGASRRSGSFVIVLPTSLDFSQLSGERSWRFASLYVPPTTVSELEKNGNDGGRRFRRGVSPRTITGDNMSRYRCSRATAAAATEFVVLNADGRVKRENHVGHVAFRTACNACAPVSARVCVRLWRMRVNDRAVALA